MFSSGSNGERLKSALDTPWKLLNEVGRLVAYPWTRLLFLLYRIPWGKGWRFYGAPIIQKHRQSQMLLGDYLHLKSAVRSNPLGPNHPVILCTWERNAVLQIGHHFAMTGGTICCAKSITIGNRVSIGANSVVADTDFHPLTAAGRALDSSAGKSAPVVIGDDVFIGMNSLVLKGVTIGPGSVIGAGSVVAADIPAHCIAAGNPARVLHDLAVEEAQPEPAVGFQSPNPIYRMSQP